MNIPWRLIILSLIILFSIENCKKKGPIILKVQGTIQTPGAGAIENTRIVLKSDAVTQGVYSSNLSTIASTTSNGQGYYEFEFERKNVNKYQIEISKEGYFKIIESINPESLTTDSPNDLSYNFYPKAWLSVHVINNAPVDNNDLMRYQNLNSFIHCTSNCCSISMKIFAGMNIDSAWTCQLHGNQFISYTYDIIKDGNIQTVKDSTYCEEFDTTYLEITY